MSLRLIKPGLSVADLPVHPTLVHPHTGEPIVALGVGKRGPIWPAIGASEDDDESSKEDDDTEDDEDDEEESKSKGKKTSKDDEDEDDKPRYTQKEYDKIRDRMRAADRRADEFANRLKALEDKDKPKDEVAARELSELKTQNGKLTDQNRELTLQVAFLSANQITWHDPEDALAMADLSEVEVDENGKVDTKALRQALRDLARRKPHLVKSSKEEKKNEDDKDEDGKDGQGSSGDTFNGKRKGQSKEKSREDLARMFPALRRG